MVRGEDNLVSFNQSKTKQAVISRKRNQNFPAVFMNGDEIDTSASFTKLGLSLSSNLTWKTHIHSLAKHASQKLGFLARALGYFSFSYLLSKYKSQTRPSLDCCLMSWVALKNPLSVFLTKSSHKAFISSTISVSLNFSHLFLIIIQFQIFPSSVDTFTGIVLRRSGKLFQLLFGVSEPPAAQLIHTRSKFHCLIHELCPTSHHSSLEHATYGTSCLPLAFLHLTTFHLSNPRSIYLI